MWIGPWELPGLVVHRVFRWVAVHPRNFNGLTSALLAIAVPGTYDLSYPLKISKEIKI